MEVLGAAALIAATGLALFGLAMIGLADRHDPLPPSQEKSDKRSEKKARKPRARQV